MAIPRLVTIMGSGETSPTMVKTHRQLLERLGEPPVPAVLLDTPFGFQENASDICTRAIHYFRDSVGAEFEVASFRSGRDAEDVVAYESVLALLRSARYVFAGPGSPSYALRQWKGTRIPGLLADKVKAEGTGGAITFASAAALTLGVAAVPVYEIYKVGENPHWLPALDLLSEAGLQVAVIPHYNNAEGGNHDTRFCYLGERRLSAMEGELTQEVFVLGVDEHTGCLLDLDESTATIVGLGVVTVRSKGRSSEIASGTTLPISELAHLAAGLASRRASPGPSRSGATMIGQRDEALTPGSSTRPDDSAPGSLSSLGSLSPLMKSVMAHEAAFDTALAQRDVHKALATILDLDDELQAWGADSLQSDEADRGRAALRSMIVRLGELAETGARDPREVVGPFVDSLLQLRARARKDRRWEDADQVRDQLIALGVEVHDAPEGTTWELGAGDPPW